MSRMSREFSLVLLGAGILSAGYFLAPDPDDELEKKADDQAAQRVHAGGGNNGQQRHYYGGHALFWVHSAGYTGGATGGRAPATASVSRGGFGGLGHTAAGG